MKYFVFTLLFSTSFHVLACETPPPPVINLDANKFYKDKLNSIIDEELKAKHDAAVAPLEKFMNEVSKLGDHFNSDSVKHENEGSCAANWLFLWATKGALLGEMKSEQSFYERKWMLAGLGLVYGKVQSAATNEQRAVIEKWFSELADRTIEHSDNSKGRKNNHYYWEGLAVGIVGRLTKNQKYLNWATNVFNKAMEDIQYDGSLPKEIARGQRALHYHLFSAAPLSVLSSVLDLRSVRLKLLVNLAFNNLQDSSQIEKLVGVPQEKEKERDFAWLEVYLRRNSNNKIETFLRPKRPLTYSKLGGNLSQRNPLEQALK